MSRIGKRPILVPANVKVNKSGSQIVVEGPKGKLSLVMDDSITYQNVDNVITLDRPSDNKRFRALHGLYGSLIKNMIIGVTQGFKKELIIEGVGYKGQMQGTKLVLDLGYSHKVEFQAPEGVTIAATSPTTLVLEGIDKQAVGQAAANIRDFRKPEPYKGKGIRYKDEQIQRKQGKKVG